MSSFQSRLESMDGPALTRIAAALSIGCTGDFSYNFPVMLFGVVSFELSSTSPHQFFLRLVLFTGLFDILNMGQVSLLSIRGIITFAVLVLKLPIYFGGLTALRERGGDLSWSRGNFVPPGWVPASMSGGQTLGGAPPEPAAPGAFPTGGFRLGGEDESRPPPRTTRDGYTSIA